MTGDEFGKALEKLELTKEAAGPFLGLSRRTVYRIAAGDYPAPVAVARLLRLMVKLRLAPEDVH